MTQIDIAMTVRKIELRINDLLISAPATMILACLCILAGCGTNPETHESEFVQTGAVFSVSCEFAWSDCYSEAQRRCANGDFEEIDRNAIERVTEDNRSKRLGPVRVDSMNQTITIRCK